MKKNDINKQYWEEKAKEEARKAYKLYLLEENKTSSPDAAHLFAIKKIGTSYEYCGLKERELILFLAGILPELYD